MLSLFLIMYFCFVDFHTAAETGVLSEEKCGGKSSVMPYDADALRKILYAEVDKDEGVRTGLRYQSAYDGPLMNSFAFESPSAVRPSSAFRFSSVVLAACTLGCITMKSRNKEKWWLGLFAVTGMHFTSFKSHKVDNGIVGHQCAFFADGMLAIGCLARLLVRSGVARRNAQLLGVSLALMWYDIGRFHMWTDYVAQLRLVVSPERSVDLLSDYVPNDVEAEFIFIRNATVKPAPHRP